GRARRAPSPGRCRAPACHRSAGSRGARPPPPSPHRGAGPRVRCARARGSPPSRSSPECGRGGRRSSRSRLLLPVGGAGGVLGGRCVAVRGGPVGRPRAAVLVGTPGRRFLGPPSGALLLALVPPGPEG